MFSCNGCRGQADKTTDTVKIDFASLASGGDKENVAPLAPSAKKYLGAVEKQKQEMKDEEERQHREQEKREKQKKQQQEEELQKERELQEQQEQQKQQEQLRRLAEEKQQQAELQRQKEERKRQEDERLRAEAEAKALAEAEAKVRAEAEAKARAEKDQKQAKLNGFLSSIGFKAVNEQKKKSGIVSSGFTYPLHAAIKANNLEAVELLLWAGADKAQKDSSKLTPAALAKKLNKKDSHKAVLTVLGE
jgi:intein/homing endonuclease